MPTTIENNVVEMSFDNSNFERNAKTSLSTIEKLKNALNFSGSANSLNELSRSADRFSMSNVGNAADLVKDKFSALEIIGVGALLRIGQQAVDTGERLVKSMSTDQIAEGWDKFAKKTTSTATLLGQGFDMDEVTEQLEKLNWFTDETSYNFTDMVDSIGKFTASGKGLTESVDAMQGIATWAALSGQNAQTASRAMYQISQAMGAGVMRKEDYKSIQNAAMDTDEFRQKALDAAVALGTLKKNADGTYASLMATGKGAEAFSKAQFAEHLTEGMWLTDKVMMQVFNDYSKGVEDIRNFAEENDLLASEVIGAKDALNESEEALAAYLKDMKVDDNVKKELSELAHNLDDFGVKAFGAAQKARTFGDAIDSVKDAASTTWMNIFELFIGNAEEATEVWTDLANYLWDVFVGPIDNLRGTLEEWIGELDNGNKDIIDIFRNIAAVIEKIVEPIKDAFSEIFPKKSGKDFKKFIDNLNKLLKNMKLDIVQTRKLKTTFLGLFTVIKSLLDIVKKILKVASPLLSVVGKIVDKVLTLGEAIGKTVTQSKKANAIVSNITDIIDLLADNIHDLTSDAIVDIKYFFDCLKNGESFIKSFATLVYDIFRNISLSIVDSIADVIEAITGIDIHFVGNFLSKMFTYARQAIVDFINNIKNNGGLKGIITILFNLVKDVGLAILQVAEDMTGIDLSNLKLRFEEMSDHIKEYLIEFVSSFNGLDTVTDKFNRLGDALDRVKGFFSGIFEGIKKTLTPIIGLFTSFFESISNQLQNNPLGTLLNVINLKTMLDIGKTIGEAKKNTESILSIFDDISGKLGKLKDGVIDVLNGVKGVLKGYQEELKAKVLRSIGIAVVMLAGSLYLLNKIDGEKIEGTLIAFAAAVGGLMGSFAAISAITNVVSVAGLAKSIPLLLTLAAVFAILAEALTEMQKAYVNEDQMLMCLLDLIAVVLFLGVAIEALNLIAMEAIPTKVIPKMILLGYVAMEIAKAALELAEAMKIMDNLDPYNMLVSFGVLTFMLTLMFEEIKELKVLKTTGAKQIITTAIALVIIGKAVKELAEAIKILTDVDPKQIVIPFIAIETAMNVLMNNASSLSNRKVFISTAIGLIAIALAVKILCDEAIKLSELDFWQIVDGFTIIGAAMFALTMTINLLKKDLLEGGIALLAISIGMNIFANSVKMLSELDLVSTVTALSMLIISLYVMVKLVDSMQQDFAQGALGVLVLASSVLILAIALKQLQGCNFLQLLGNTVILLASMVALIYIAGMCEDMLPGIAALLIISAAFLVFATAVSMIGKFNPLILLENMAVAVGALAIVVLGLVGISAIFMNVGPMLLAGAALFAASIAVIALGMYMLGLSLSSISMGITALEATSGIAGDALITICSAIRNNKDALVSGSGWLLLLGAAMLVAGIGGAVLAVAGAAIGIAIAVIAIALFTLTGAMALFNLTLSSFSTNAQLAGTALILLTTSMVSCTPGLITAGVEMFALKKVFDKLSGIFETFATEVSSLGTSMMMLGISFATFNTTVESFEEASNNLIESFETMVTRVTASMALFSVTLTAGSSVLFNNASKVFKVMGANLIVGFVSGMNSKTALAYTALKVMAAKCIAITRLALAIHSPSRVFKEIGGYTVAGFAQGLSDTTESDSAAEDLGNSAIKSLQSAMTSAVDNLSSDTNDPVIKPIMDLTDVQNGSSYLDAMVSRDRASSISTEYKSNREIQEEMNAKNNSLLSDLNNQLTTAISGEDGSGMPVNVNITLAGDAEGIFRVVMNENSRMIKTRGYSPLLR